MSGCLVLGMEQIQADRNCVYEFGRGIMEVVVILKLTCMGFYLHLANASAFCRSHLYDYERIRKLLLCNQDHCTKTCSGRRLACFEFCQPRLVM
jgi:hypothetical protein